MQVAKNTSQLHLACSNSLFSLQQKSEEERWAAILAFRECMKSSFLHSPCHSVVSQVTTGRSAIPFTPFSFFLEIILFLEPYPDCTSPKNRKTVNKLRRPLIFVFLICSVFHSFFTWERKLCFIFKPKQWSPATWVWILNLPIACTVCNLGLWLNFSMIQYLHLKNRDNYSSFLKDACKD